MDEAARELRTWVGQQIAETAVAKMPKIAGSELVKADLPTSVYLRPVHVAAAVKKVLDRLVGGYEKTEEVEAIRVLFRLDRDGRSGDRWNWANNKLSPGQASGPALKRHRTSESWFQFLAEQITMEEGRLHLAEAFGTVEAWDESTPRLSRSPGEAIEWAYRKVPDPSAVQNEKWYVDLGALIRHVGELRHFISETFLRGYEPFDQRDDHEVLRDHVLGLMWLFGKLLAFTTRHFGDDSQVDSIYEISLTFDEPDGIVNGVYDLAGHPQLLWREKSLVRAAVAPPADIEFHTFAERLELTDTGRALVDRFQTWIEACTRADDCACSIHGFLENCDDFLDDVAEDYIALGYERHPPLAETAVRSGGEEDRELLQQP